MSDFNEWLTMVDGMRRDEDERRKRIKNIPPLESSKVGEFKTLERDQPGPRMNPEFRADHPTAAKVIDTIGKVTVPVGDFLAPDPVPEPSLRNIEPRIRQEATNIMLGLNEPLPETGTPWADIPTSLVGFGLGLVDNPAGAMRSAGGMAIKGGKALIDGSPQVAGKLMPKVNQLPELGQKATKGALSGAVGGAGFGAYEGMSQNLTPQETAKRIAEDTLLFGGMEAGLPVLGAGVKAGVRGISGKVKPKSNPIDDTLEQDLDIDLFAEVVPSANNLDKSFANREPLALTEGTNWRTPTPYETFSALEKQKTKALPGAEEPLPLPEGYYPNWEMPTPYETFKALEGQRPKALTGKPEPLALPEGYYPNWQEGTGYPIKDRWFVDPYGNVRDVPGMAKELPEGKGDLFSRNISNDEAFVPRSDIGDPAYLSGLEKRYNELIGKEVARMKGELGGVLNYMPDQNGPLMRASMNPKWYRDFWQTNERAPRTGEYRNIAVNNLIKGAETNDGMMPANEEFLSILSELSRGQKLPEEWHGLQKSISEMGNNPELQGLKQDMLAEQAKVEPYGLNKDVNRLTEIEGAARKQMTDKMDYAKDLPEEAIAKFKMSKSSAKKAVGDLNRILGIGPRDKNRYQVDAKAYDNPEFAAADQLAQAVSGRGVIPFKSVGETSEDMFGVSIGEKIYLNSETTEPMLYVTAHETVHKMEITHPEHYGKLQEITMKYIADDEGLVKHYEKMGYELMDIPDEFVADAVAESMLQPTFWQRVRQDAPELIKPILDVLDNIINTVKQTITDDMTIMPYLKNVEKMRDEVAVVYKDYLNALTREQRGLEKPKDTRGAAAKLKEGIDKLSPTDTPEFRKWFGDSKVVDGNGKPLVVYHGSKDKQKIDAFSPKRSNYNGLMFFSEDPTFAYAWSRGDNGEGVRIGAEGDLFYKDDTLLSDYMNKEQLAKMRGNRRRRSLKYHGNVYPVYLSIKNPFRRFKNDKEVESLENFLEKNKGYTPEEAAYFAEDVENGYQTKENPDFVEWAKKRGYDGLVVSEGGSVNDACNYAVFSPTQIKSATGNRGAWDVSNPDIRMKKAAPNTEPNSVRQANLNKFAEIATEAAERIPKGLNYNAFADELVGKYGERLEKFAPYIWEQAVQLNRKGKAEIRFKDTVVPLRKNVKPGIQAAVDNSINKDYDTAQSIKSYDEIKDSVNLPETIKQAYRKTVDRFNALNDVDNYMRKSTGKGLSDSDKLYIKATNSTSSGGIAQQIMEKHMVDFEGNPVGESFGEVINKAADVVGKNNWKAFEDYNKLKHAGSWMRLGRDVYPAESGLSEPVRRIKETWALIEKIKKDTTIDKAQKEGVIKQLTSDIEGMNVGIQEAFTAPRMAQLEQQFPGIQQASQEYGQWINKFVEEWAVKPGLISKEEWAALQKEFPDYVPLQRVMDTVEEGISFPGAGFANQKKPIKKGRGSERDTIESIEVMIERIPQYVVEAKRNEVAQNLYKMMQAAPKEMEEAWGKIVTVKPGDPHKENIITARVDGKEVSMEIYNPALLDAMAHLSKKGQDSVVELVRSATGVMKTLTTGVNPFFSIGRNVFYDTPQAYINSKTLQNVKGVNNPVQFTVDLMDSLIRILTNEKWHKDKYLQMYRDMGGGQFTSASAADRDLVAETKAKILPGYYDKSKPIKSAGRGIKAGYGGLQRIMSVTETLPRLPEFKRSVQQGGNTYESKVKGLYEANDITFNFSRSGEIGKTVDAFVPYFNAAVQGMDKVGRAFKDNPVGATGNAIISVTIPTLILYSINHNNPEYQKLSEMTKSRYYCLPKDDGTFIKIVKPRESGTVFGTAIEDALEYLKTQDKDTFDSLMAGIKNNFLPPIRPVWAPATTDLIANKDFAGRPIVPGYLEGHTEPNQFDARTSEPAKWLGKKLNASPKKIDYVARSYGGVIGQVGQPLTTEGTGLGETVARQYTADPVYSNDVFAKFYDELTKLNEAHKDTRAGLPNKANDERRYTAMNRVARKLSDKRKEIRKVEANNKMDPKIKKNKLREMQAEMVDIASQALKGGQ